MREDRLGEGEKTEHFIVPDGMSSLVKHFFKKSGAELNFGRRVAEVNRRDSLWQARRIRRREILFLALKGYVAQNQFSPTCLSYKGKDSCLMLFCSDQLKSEALIMC